MSDGEGRMVTSKPRRENDGNCDRGDELQRVATEAEAAG